MMDRVVTPSCIGFCDANDATCQGVDGDAKTGVQSVKPCQWRDRCMGLGRWLEDHKERSVDSLVRIVDDGVGKPYAVALDGRELMRIMDDEVKRWRIQDGAPKSKIPREVAQHRHRGFHPPLAEATTAKARKYRGTIRAKHRELMVLWTEFFGQVKALLASHGHSFRGTGVTPAPGGAILSDRRTHSGWMAIYIRGFRGRNVPVLLTYLRPGKVRIDVAFPMTSETLRRYAAQDMAHRFGVAVEEVTVAEQSRWHSAIKGCDSAGLKWVSDHVLRRMLSDGVLGLPAPRGRSTPA